MAVVEPKVEAAGIEPASDDSRNGRPSRGFTFETTLWGKQIVVKRDGKHANVHLIDHEDWDWRFVEVSDAIPVLRALLSAAEMMEME